MHFSYAGFVFGGEIKSCEEQRPTVDEEKLDCNTPASGKACNSLLLLLLLLWWCGLGLGGRGEWEVDEFQLVRSLLELGG